MIARRIPSVLVCLMLMSLMTVACDNGSSPAAPTPTLTTGVRAIGGLDPGTPAINIGPLPPGPTLRITSTSTPYPATNTPSPLTNTPLPPSSTPTHVPTNTSTPMPGTPLPSPTATEVVDVLARLVLQTYEVPSGLTLDPTSSGEQSNETVANGDATRLGQLKTWGRQTGYVNVYRAASTVATGTVALLSSAAASYASADGADSAWADAVQRLQGSSLPLAAVAGAPHYTVHSAILTYTDPSTTAATAVLLVASGHLVAEITIVGTKVSPTALYPLAQIIVPRLVAAP